MVSYVLTPSRDIVQRNNDDGSLTFIPAGHPDWVAYLAWVTLGNAPAPYVAPPVADPVPSETDKLAALLVARGVLAPVDVTQSVIGSAAISPLSLGVLPNV